MRLLFNKISENTKEIFSDKNFLKWLKISSLIFLAFFVLGFIFSASYPGQSMELFEALSEKMSSETQKSFWGLAYFIWENNFLIAFLAVLSGIIFGLPTYLILAVNAFVVGVVIKIAADNLGFWIILGATIPHGVFEIPAILFSFSLGFILGESLFLFLFRKQSIKKRLKLVYRSFLGIVFPLLVIAALVEAALIVFLR